MRLNDNWYDVMKWCTLVLIPACTTLYVALSAIWGFPYAAEVAKTSAAVCCFLGAILGISTAEYRKENISESTEEDNAYELKEQDVEL